MPLNKKRLLLRAAKLSLKEEEKISKREIEKKINQIKHLTGKNKVSRISVRKEILQLERLLRGVLRLKDKLKEKDKEKSKEISKLKKQIRELRKKMSDAKDVSLRKKVNKLSHLLNDLVAKEEIKKEVRFEEVKQIELSKELIPNITLKKINELRERIFTLKESGGCPPEKIAELKKRLTNLEKKLPIRSIPAPREKVKHKMLFGPKIIQVNKDLPLPPPPEKKELD